MINLDKLTIFETHIPDQHLTEFKARVQVHASCNVSDEATTSAVRLDLAAAARDAVRRKIWNDIYGGDLRDQVDHVAAEAHLLPRPTEKLWAEISKLLDMLAYKP